MREAVDKERADGERADQQQRQQAPGPGPSPEQLARLAKDKQKLGE